MSKEEDYYDVLGVCVKKNASIHKYTHAHAFTFTCQCVCAHDNNLEVEVCPACARARVGGSVMFNVVFFSVAVALSVMVFDFSACLCAGGAQCAGR